MLETPVSLDEHLISIQLDPAAAILVLDTENATTLMTLVSPGSLLELNSPQ